MVLASASLNCVTRLSSFVFPRELEWVYTSAWLRFSFRLFFLSMHFFLHLSLFLYIYLSLPRSPSSTGCTGVSFPRRRHWRGHRRPLRARAIQRVVAAVAHESRHRSAILAHVRGEKGTYFYSLCFLFYLFFVLFSLLNCTYGFDFVCMHMFFMRVRVGEYRITSCSRSV